jgi:hypothetical protein
MLASILAGNIGTTYQRSRLNRRRVFGFNVAPIY